MPKYSDRARYISVLSVTAAAVVALAACGSGGSTSTPAPASSTVVTTSTPPPTSPTVTTTTGPPPTSPSLAGQLTGPRDGSKVAYHQQVSGVVTGLPPGADAWIVVYPENAPAWWPQGGPLQLDTTGGFLTSVYFGESDTQNIGDYFVLKLVIATSAASARFRAFLAQQPFPNQGLSQLPAGVQSLVTITVTRR